MKRGTAAKVILGKDTLMDVPAGIVHGTDVILGGKAGLLNDFGGLVLSNNLMIGKKVSRGTITTVTVRGVAPIILPDAIAGSLQAVKAFGGTEQRDIPDSYLQRQYIYMTDGSYIRVEDLPISAGYKVEFDFQVKTLGSALRNYLGGRADGVSAGGGFRLSKLASGGTNLNRVVMYGFETGTEYYDPTTQFQADTRYKYTYDNGVCTLESGGSVISTNTFTPTDTTSTDWGINDYCSNGGWSTNHDGMYVYSVKVWDDQGELVMDLVPAVQRGTVPVVGFYDAATGGFRGPTGGTFAAGPEAVPTPDAPISIVCNNGVLKYSKNLLDMSAENIVLGKYINNSGDVVDSPYNFYNSKYIPVVAGETYTWSTSSSVNYFSVMEYDNGYVFKRRSLFGAGSSSPAGTSGTITLRSDTAFVLLGSNMGGAEITLDKIVAVDWQFEKGSTATDYMPYGQIYADGTVETVEDTIGNTATAEMLLKVGDYQDVQSIIDGVVTRNVGIVILDGTENWSLGTVFSADNVAQRAVFPSTSMSTHFVGNVSSTSPNLFKNNSFKVGASGYRNRIYIKATQYADETEFKAFLAQQYANGTPVIVVYPLETPTTESVAGQTLQVQAGDNVLEITQASLDGLELEATYKSLVQLTIQEVEDANLNNNVEVTIS